MNNILTIASGVFLGEFLWAIVLFIILYILFRHIINSVKARIYNTGFHILGKGSGFLKGGNFGANVTVGSAKRFVRYSGDVVNSTFKRVRR